MTPFATFFQQLMPWSDLVAKCDPSWVYSDREIKKQKRLTSVLRNI
jgi:hypothetical protein